MQYEKPDQYDDDLPAPRIQVSEQILGFVRKSYYNEPWPDSFI